MDSLRFFCFVLITFVLCFQICVTLAQDDVSDVEDTGGTGRSQGPPYTICDDECQKQVKILEGFIALIMLGCGLGVGICCLKCINTPTAFASSGISLSKKRD